MHVYPTRRPRSPWPLFAALFLLMLVGHLDRLVVVPMFPVLRETWALSDAQLGTLVSVVSLMVACWAIPLSLAADRLGHVRAITAMVLVWSAATLACAFAESYVALLALRALVGLGQAAFGAVSAALLATRFPERSRGTILGTYPAAGLVGNAVGVFAGGVLTAHWGWQTAFVVAALPGFVLVAVLLLLEWRVAGPARASTVREGGRRSEHLRALVRSRTVLLVCTASGLQLLTVATLASWLPTYLHRALGHDVARAGSLASVVLLVAVGGAIGWGALGDRLGAGHAVARVHLAAWLSAATGLLAIAAFALLPPGAAQYAVLVGVGALMTGYLGPSAACVVDRVHPSVRATATATLAFTHNMLGLALGPVLAGAVSDAFGLTVAMGVAPVASLLAAVGFALAARSQERERAAAAGLPLGERREPTEVTP
jgi:MFS family permease